MALRDGFLPGRFCEVIFITSSVGRRVRKGPYGAFILLHDDVGPSLWIHINRNVAYLHFFLETQSTSHAPNAGKAAEAR